MTTKIGGIVVDIDARLTKLESSLARANSSLGRFERNVKRQGSAIAASTRGIESAFSRMQSAIAGAIGFQTVRSMLALADASKQLDAQLRLATRNSGSF